jgi:hypothetical protein
MLKLLLGLLIIAAGSSAALATDVAFDDILGRWCVAGSGNINTFTKSQLFVESPRGWKRTLIIKKVEVNRNRIYIDWAPPYVNSGYELSDDKRTLFQLPTVDENGKAVGDNGPRRELHRC